MTGLAVQPIIGAISDRTLSRLGRRTPFFLIGAVIWAPRVHAVCLAVSGAAMATIAWSGQEYLLFMATIGIGISWAGMMGNTYVMLAGAIPPSRTGAYIGIFNMFIVIPMLIETLTMPLIYRPLLGGDPRNALAMGASLMVLGALATLRVSRHS